MGTMFAFGAGALVFGAMAIGRRYVIRYMKWLASLGGDDPGQFDDPSVEWWIIGVGVAGAAVGTLGFVGSLGALLT
jgi:hypothetical protein